MQLEVPRAGLYRNSKVRTRAAEKEKAAAPKLETTLVLWLILFVFGGGLLALYYAGIGYFPEVSWQDALTFMALMTIIGGSLLVAYGFLLFVPGAIWSRFLICDEQIHDVLKMSTRPGEPCVWLVTKRILFPFALFMASCHFLLFLQHQDGPQFAAWVVWGVAVGALASLMAASGLLVKDLGEALEKGAGNEVPSKLTWHRLHVIASHVPLLIAFIDQAFGDDPGPGRGFLWTAALLPFASFLGLFIYGWFKSARRRILKEEAPQSEVPDKPSLLWRAALAFGTAALLSLAALWFFHRIYKGGAPVPWDLLLLCTLVVIVTNLVVSVVFDTHWRQALLASFLAALLLLGAGNLLGKEAGERLPAKIMERFGFGGQSVVLVMTEKGGRMLCQQKVPVQFEKRRTTQDSGLGSSEERASGNTLRTAESNPQEEGSLALAIDVEILSRLGSEYLLRFGERTIALPKKEVVSWSAAPPQGEALEIQDSCKLPSATSTSTKT